MRRASRGVRVLGLLVAFVSSADSVFAAEDLSALDRAARDFVVQEHVAMRMRDGTQLYGHVLLPEAGATSRGTVLIRSPYELANDEAGEREAAIRLFLQRGHAVVLQNERGRYFSEGSYRTMTGAADDGADTIDWVVAQPWSNGRVATYGCSSSAENQLKLATINHPAHVAAVMLSPAVAIDRVGALVERGQVWRGGAFQQDWISWFHDFGHLSWPAVRLPEDATARARYVDSFTVGTTSAIPSDWPQRAQGFPQIDAMSRLKGPLTELEEWMRRPVEDPAWSRGLVSDQDDVRVPSLWMTGWFDYAPHLDIELFEVMRSRRYEEGRSNQKLIVAPGFHCSFESEEHKTRIGDLVVRNASLKYISVIGDWMDAYLSGDAVAIARVEGWPAIRSHTIGADQWNAYARWPPANSHPLRMYLGATSLRQEHRRLGKLGSVPPSVSETVTLHSDPNDPVPSRGGGGYPGDLGDAHPLGSVIQTEVERRPDVVVFRSDALQSDHHLAGRVRVRLQLFVDARDADVAVKFVRIDRRGRSWNLADTILRLRYRYGFSRSVLLTPGEIVTATLPDMAVDAHFRRGDRFGIQIAASNWPKYTVNSQDGTVPETAAAGLPADITVVTGGSNPSWIEVPVIGEATEGPLVRSGEVFGQN